LVESSKEIWKEIDIYNAKSEIFAEPSTTLDNFKNIFNLYKAV
jgi:hypothetical protein